MRRARLRGAQPEDYTHWFHGIVSDSKWPRAVVEVIGTGELRSYDVQQVILEPTAVVRAERVRRSSESIARCAKGPYDGEVT